MLTYPTIDPVAMHIGPLSIHWYGIMYLIGFTSAWGLAWYRIRRPQYADWSSDEINDLIFYAAIGVIIGGRVGYMLIYNTTTLFDYPMSLFKIWQGGMSFHGGFIGVCCALWIFAKVKQKTVFTVTDFIVPLVPIGLAAGRLGNFINGELWGRATDVPWAMVFPHADHLPRHPSQLYEFLLEGVALFILLWIYARKPKPPAAVSGVFLIGYSCVRILCELFRQPDPQLGFMAWGWLTMGQLLSIPLLLLGCGLVVYAYRFDNKAI